MLSLVTQEWKRLSALHPGGEFLKALPLASSPQTLPSGLSHFPGFPESISLGLLPQGVLRNSSSA